MRRLAIAAAAALPAMLASALPALAVEVALDKVPAPILETVKARFPDLKMTEAATEKNEKGETIYEISLDNHGLNIDATFMPEGPMVLMEKQIERASLPKPVAGTLEKEFPKARYRILEEVYQVKDKEESLAYYEALLWTAQKQLRGVEVAADGKLLKVEKKNAEEEED